MSIPIPPRQQKQPQIIGVPSACLRVVSKVLSDSYNAMPFDARGGTPVWFHIICPQRCLLR